jgi:hypothetical protein
MRTFCLIVGLLFTTSFDAAPATQPSLQQKCETALANWRAKFDEEHFQYVIAPPFVIAGNGSAQQIATYRDRTIVAAAKALKQLYFKADPDEPVVILLFESEGPYRRLAKKWLGDEDVPHYGYFRHDNVMVMNVGTGTGTLVHELTHALIKPDFPDVPSWFNEGLASLYEQCSMNGGTIRGLVNWRLPGLQKAINAGTLRPLEELMGDPKFYHEDKVGVNYAEARYLMLYLQEKGLLRQYYRAFRDHAADDPTGLATLKQVIGPKELGAFEKEWREWVMGLRFE